MGIADGGLRAEVQRWLRKPDWDWTPIETGGTQAGVPDSYWTHPATRTSGWVEHKATTGWAVEVRPHQVGWIDRHVRAGVRVHIAVRARGAGSSGGAGDSLWLLRGSCAKILQEDGLERLPSWAVLGVWRGAPRTWSWQEVAALLTSSGTRDLS